MCFTHLKTNFFSNLKIPQGGGGCATPPNVPKLGVSSLRIPQKMTKIETSQVAYS